MNARPNPFEQLAARLEALEERVQSLEDRQGHESAAVPVSPLVEAVPAAAWPDPLPQFTGLVPLLGSGLLGVAGAYALRAVSGASLLPRSLVALIAAIYAGAWLFAAARTGRAKVAGVLYGAVSILILGPMLWEMTVRFNAMRGTTAAAILGLYVGSATALGLWRYKAAVFSIAFAGAAVTALALSIATHSMVEFTYLLLGMLVVCEALDRRLKVRGIRLLVALTADAAVWALLAIYRLDPGSRTDYPAVSTSIVLAAAMLLLSVELTAVTRKVVAGLFIPMFLAVQAMIAFGLAAAALVWLAPGSATAVLGVVCLVMAAGCYAAAFGPVRRSGQRRNFRVLSIWAACLLPAAIFILLPLAAGSVVLAAMALLAIPLARRIQSKTLELEGVVFLLAGAIGSHLLSWAAGTLAGHAPNVPSGATLAAAACAVLAYVVAGERSGEEVRKQALHLVPALLAGLTVTALLVLSLLDLVKLALTPDVFHVALIRTFALCFVALGLAFAGARLARPAMVRTAYAAVAFVAAKLLFEDLRHGHMEFIAAAIFAVALTLIAVPRLTRGNKKQGTGIGIAVNRD